MRLTVSQVQREGEVGERADGVDEAWEEEGVAGQGASKASRGVPDTKREGCQEDGGVWRRTRRGLGG